MLAGHRDLSAHALASQLTAASEMMWRKSTHKETVREIDMGEIDKLRFEIDKLRNIIIAIGDAVDAELKRRAA